MLYYDISFQGIKKSPSLRAMMTIWAWYIVNLYLEHTFLILCFLKWICYEVTFMLLPPLFCKMIMQFPCNLVLFVQNEKWLREVALQEYIKLVSLLRCTGVIRLVGRLSAFLCVHASSVVKKKKKKYNGFELKRLYWLREPLSMSGREWPVLTISDPRVRVQLCRKLFSLCILEGTGP